MNHGGGHDAAAPAQHGATHGAMNGASGASGATAAYAEAMEKMDAPMMDGIMDPDPDVAFVKGMIPHHQGAIDSGADRAGIWQGRAHESLGGPHHRGTGRRDRRDAGLAGREQEMIFATREFDDELRPLRRNDRDLDRRDVRSDVSQHLRLVSRFADAAGRECEPAGRLRRSFVLAAGETYSGLSPPPTRSRGVPPHNRTPLIMGRGSFKNVVSGSVSVGDGSSASAESGLAIRLPVSTASEVAPL